MSLNKMLALVGLAAVGIVGSVARDGFSDTIPAMAGHAWFASDVACFNSSWSQTTNSCSRTAKLLIPIQSRSNGNVTFKATSNASGPICVVSPTCRAVVTNQANGFIAQTAATLVCGGGSPTTLGTLSVASTSVAHYDCDFDSGETLTSVAF